jgi:hypothetical protein
MASESTSSFPAEAATEGSHKHNDSTASPPLSESPLTPHHFLPLRLLRHGVGAPPTPSEASQAAAHAASDLFQSERAREAVGTGIPKALISSVGASLHDHRIESLPWPSDKTQAVFVNEAAVRAPAAHQQPVAMPTHLHVQGAGLTAVNGTYASIEQGGWRMQGAHNKIVLLQASGPAPARWALCDDFDADDESPIVFYSSTQGSASVPPLTGWRTDKWGFDPPPSFVPVVRSLDQTTLGQTSRRWAAGVHLADACEGGGPAAQASSATATSSQHPATSATLPLRASSLQGLEQRRGSSTSIETLQPFMSMQEETGLAARVLQEDVGIAQAGRRNAQGLSKGQGVGNLEDSEGTREWNELLCDAAVMRISVDGSGGAVGIGVSGVQKQATQAPWLFARVDVSRMPHSQVAALLASSSGVSSVMQISVLGRHKRSKSFLWSNKARAHGKMEALGMMLGTMTLWEDVKSYSCTFVTRVTPRSLAHRAGIEAGDRVMSITTARVKSLPGLVLL